MRGFFLGCLGSAALVAASMTAAAAADLPARAPVYKAPPPVALYSWTGFYIGGHVGGLWGSKDWTDVTAPVAVAIGSHDVSGFIGGGQVGFNWQTGSWVWGAEAQFSWTNGDGDHVFAAGLTRASTDLNWLGTAAFRLGYAMDRVLLYAKGGAAWVNEDSSVSTVPGGVLLATNNDNTRWGWMVGAGIEWAMWQNWSAKIEYNFMDFGSRNSAFIFAPGGAPCCTINIDQQLHVVKLGLNYRFGGGGPVVARY